MNIFGMSQWEMLLIMVVILVIIGPDRLPAAMENLRRWVRQARDLANQARGELREQVGDDIAELDWRKWDPRQYNPRRIVREALLEDLNPFAEDSVAVGEDGVQKPSARRDGSPATEALGARGGWGGPRDYDPLVATPFDVDAT